MRRVDVLSGHTAGTIVHGASDDLIEFKGDLYGEVDALGAGDEKNPLGVLVAFSDGTILAVRYGKPALGGVWAIDVLRAGELFDRLVVCTDEDAEVYSDLALFRPGKLRAWAAKRAEIVK